MGALPRAVRGLHDTITVCVSAGDLSQGVDAAAGQGYQGLPEEVARRLFQQLLVALDFCHRLGIANRDVKVCRRPAACVILV